MQCKSGRSRFGLHLVGVVDGAWVGDQLMHGLQSWESEGEQVGLCRLLEEVEKRPLYSLPHHMWCLEEWTNRRRFPRHHHHLPWHHQHVPCHRLLPQQRSSEVPVGASSGPHTPTTSPGVHVRLKGVKQHHHLLLHTGRGDQASFHLPLSSR